MRSGIYSDRLRISGLIHELINAPYYTHVQGMAYSLSASVRVHE